jgi:hypothetical protein
MQTAVASGEVPRGRHAQARTGKYAQGKKKSCKPTPRVRGAPKSDPHFRDLASKCDGQEKTQNVQRERYQQEPEVICVHGWIGVAD